MTQIPVALAACLSVGTLSAVALAPWLVRTRLAVRRAHAERDAALREQQLHAADLQAWRDETRHLVESRLPALAVTLRHSHTMVPGLAHPHLVGSVLDGLHRSILDLFARTVADERTRVDQAAQAAVRGATTAMQAKSYQLQDLLNSMQHRYDDPRVSQDLLALDGLNEQILRRIQVAGIVCGATAGLTRTDSHLGDIVVGAQSRVFGYERIKISSRLTTPVGVVARAAEPIAVAVTELMANAVHHSHGSLDVDVSIHLSETGAVVLVDDAGVGMNDAEIDRATRMLSGRTSVVLTELGDPPRMGFAAIGRLVHQFGFSVAVDKPAPYGGVRAVVHIPAHLLILIDEAAVPMSPMAPLPRPAPARQDAGPESSASLPRRRRRAAAPEAQPLTAATAWPAPEDTTARSAVWGAIQRGTASGRGATYTDPQEGTSHR
ncbi:ATP-binding protein [Streptomyces gardneri]|uniref:ATP-binding protein n=1 Tax=Streptomyces gardneri TaxID=66892 RepID=UPI00367D9D9E